MYILLLDSVTVHCSRHVVKNGWQWILPTSATGTELTSNVCVCVCVCVRVCVCARARACVRVYMVNWLMETSCTLKCKWNVLSLFFFFQFVWEPVTNCDAALVQLVADGIHGSVVHSSLCHPLCWDLVCKLFLHFYNYVKTNGLKKLKYYKRAW